MCVDLACRSSPFEARWIALHRHRCRKSPCRRPCHRRTTRLPCHRRTTRLPPRRRKHGAPRPRRGRTRALASEAVRPLFFRTRLRLRLRAPASVPSPHLQPCPTCPYPTRPDGAPHSGHSVVECQKRQDQGWRDGADGQDGQDDQQSPRCPPHGSQQGHNPDASGFARKQAQVHQDGRVLCRVLEEPGRGSGWRRCGWAVCRCLHISTLVVTVPLDFH